jgi:hypothetical protein
MSCLPPGRPVVRSARLHLARPHCALPPGRRLSPNLALYLSVVVSAAAAAALRRRRRSTLRIILGGHRPLVNRRLASGLPLEDDVKLCRSRSRCRSRVGARQQLVQQTTTALRTAAAATDGRTDGGRDGPPSSKRENGYKGMWLKGGGRKDYFDYRRRSRSRSRRAVNAGGQTEIKV